MILLAVSFIAGVLTVLAPCILPLLPVIVGGSISGAPSLRKAATVSLSLGASVFIFTILLKATTVFITIPALFWQLFSGVLLILFGVVTCFPSAWDRIPVIGELYRSSNRLLGSGYQKQGFWGDIGIGAALGPVFSSCSPTYFIILATVLPVNFGAGLIYLLSYCIGLSLFLFCIAFLGQKVATVLGVASDPHGWFKKSIGLLFILIGIGILFGIDKRIEAALPPGAFGETLLEQKLLSLTHSKNTSPATGSTSTSTPLSPRRNSLNASQKALRFAKAPELVSPDGFLNTGGSPITISQYKGKNVVLVDFWDYSCINCQRTIPYLNAWYTKYKDVGLVIVGVHTPEFAFEQLQQNVSDATKRFGISYPVVLDNTYKTWSSFGNQYWPHEYLIDIDGYVVYDHVGEGQYDESEKAIQKALAERSARLGGSAVATSTVALKPADLSAVQSPETYFGASRNEYLGNGVPGASGVQQFVLPSSPMPNTLYLGGSWDIQPEFARALASSTVGYYYSSRDVYLVASSHIPLRLQVIRDGLPVGKYAGADVDPTTSILTIEGDRLYKLIHDPMPGAHTVELRVIDSGVDLYTFTFG